MHTLTEQIYFLNFISKSHDSGRTECDFFFRSEAPRGLTQRQESPKTCLSPPALQLTDAGMLTGSRRNHLPRLFTTTTFISSVISDHHFHHSICCHLSEIGRTTPPQKKIHSPSGWINVSPIIFTFILRLIHKSQAWNIHTVMRTNGNQSTGGGRSGVGGWRWVSQRVKAKFYVENCFVLMKKKRARDREDRKKLLVRVGTALFQYHHLVPMLT